MYIYIYIYLLVANRKNCRMLESCGSCRDAFVFLLDRPKIATKIRASFFHDASGRVRLATRAERFSPKPNPGVTKIEIGGRTGARQGAHVRRRRRSSTHIIRTVFRVAIVCAFPGLSSLRNY